MAGSNTYGYPTHANTQEYCCATHVCTTQREPCEFVSEELISPVVKIPLCCKDVPLHGVCVCKDSAAARGGGTPQGLKRAKNTQPQARRSQERAKRLIADTHSTRRR